MKVAILVNNNHHSPYYIITMVFHNQNNDISEDIIKFNNELVLLGFDEQHCVHKFHSALIITSVLLQLLPYMVSTYSSVLPYYHL